MLLIVNYLLSIYAYRVQARVCRGLSILFKARSYPSGTIVLNSSRWSLPSTLVQIYWIVAKWKSLRHLCTTLCQIEFLPDTCQSCHECGKLYNQYASSTLIEFGLGFAGNHLTLSYQFSLIELPRRYSALSYLGRTHLNHSWLMYKFSWAKWIYNMRELLPLGRYDPSEYMFLKLLGMTHQSFSWMRTCYPLSLTNANS